MDKSRFKGIIPAVVTPLRKDQTLDEEGFKKVIDYLIENGVHGLFVCGSQGESYSLSIDEKKRVIDLAVDETDGRVTVYAGAGDVTTENTIALSKYALDVGADAVSLVTPYFIKPTQSELYQHYEKIARSVDIPIILYNNVRRTGVNLDAPTVKSLAQIENIVGIKDSSGDLALTAEYIYSCPKDFCVLAGMDSLILATLLYGGKGAIAATANFAPKLVVGIYDSFVRGDLDKAREFQFKLFPFRLAFNLGTFPVVVKEAMELIGKPAGPARSPVGPLSKENRKKLRNLLVEGGLLESKQ